MSVKETGIVLPVKYRPFAGNEVETQHGRGQQRQMKAQMRIQGKLYSQDLNTASKRYVRFQSTRQSGRDFFQTLLISALLQLVRDHNGFAVGSVSQVTFFPV